MRFNLRLYLTAAAILCSMRCAAFYNQQQHETAQSAQKSFTEAKLVESVKEERTQNADILARELKVVEQQMIANRDAKLMQILRADSIGEAARQIQDAATVRLTALTGQDRDLIVDLVRAADLEEETEWDRSDYLSRKSPEDPKAVCTAQGDTMEISKGAEDAWDSFQKLCAELKTLHAKIESTTAPGEIADISRRIAGIAKARSEVAAEVQRISAKFKAAKKEADQARKNGTPINLADRAKEFQEDLGDITEKAKGLGKLNDASVLATLEWVEVQKSSIDRLLGAAVSGATTVPPGVDDDIQIATIVPALATDLMAATRFPRVVKLVLESERLRIEGDRLRRQIARLDQEDSFLREKRDVLLEELGLLDEVTADLKLDPPPVPPEKDDALCTAEKLARKATIRTAAEPCRSRVASALVGYANAWTLYRIPARQLDWKGINLEHERVLDGSEVALAQWNNLILPTLDVLVANHGSGIKADSLGRLFGNLQLAWIGLGVQ